MMKQVHSMVICFDGKSKCGKTTIINAVANEVAYQATVIPDLLAGRFKFERSLLDDVQSNVTDLQDALTFDSITSISAGNMFRAAAYYKLTMNRSGHNKSSFTSEDTAVLRELVKQKAVQHELQNDPTIERHVSYVAQMPGVQKLCGALFSDAVKTSYHTDNGANLVIVDARNPVGALQRNNAIGSGSDHIDAASVMPIYVHTPVRVAAGWLPGNFHDNAMNIRRRRYADAIRDELPVSRPTNFIDEFNPWLRQFNGWSRDSDVVTPLRLRTTEHVTLDVVQNFAGRIATAAQDVACVLFHSKINA